MGGSKKTASKGKPKSTSSTHASTMISQWLATGNSNAKKGAKPSAAVIASEASSMDIDTTPALENGANNAPIQSDSDFDPLLDIPTNETSLSSPIAFIEPHSESDVGKTKQRGTKSRKVAEQNEADKAVKDVLAMYGSSSTEADDLLQDILDPYNEYNTAINSSHGRAARKAIPRSKLAKTSEEDSHHLVSNAEPRQHGEYLDKLIREQEAEARKSEHLKSLVTELSNDPTETSALGMSINPSISDSKYALIQDPSMYIPLFKPTISYNPKLYFGHNTHIIAITLNPNDVPARDINSNNTGSSPPSIDQSEALHAMEGVETSAQLTSQYPFSQSQPIATQPPPIPMTSPWTIESQHILESQLSKLNSISQLPLLQKILSRVSCCPSVAHWLTDLAFFFKYEEISFDAFSVLMSLLPRPTLGWPSKLCYATHAASTEWTSTPSSPRQNFPFAIDFEWIKSTFIKFGASNEGKVIFHSFDLVERRMNSIQSVEEIDDMMTQLQKHTTASARSSSRDLAAHYDDIQRKNAESLFSFKRFAHFSLFVGASVFCSMIHLSVSELIEIITYFYRALVDPHCHKILAEVVVAIEYLLISLSSSTNETEFPRNIRQLCIKLYSSMPEPKKDCHEALYRMVWATPVSSPILRSVRSAMAYYFLTIQLDPNQLEINDPSTNIESYRLGNHWIPFNMVIDELGRTVLPKDFNQWSAAANWVLLADIAFSTLPLDTMYKFKKSINRWVAVLTSFSQKARENGSQSDIKLTRFKDIVVMCYSKMTVISNSRSAPNAFEAFKVKTDPSADFK